MPQLARVRIVNFQYNNGKRLIPDELYDFSDSRGNACANTLIALINGGGKSVLVQLMLQPVLPEAKVSKRQIKDFFTSASCHCFIVLEWLLDNSPVKLLTGISMAAGVTASASISDDDSPEKRGRSIRYYTFCADYTDDSAPCAIATLPLSRNVNGLFEAAEYDCIRKLKNRGGMGNLKCYSSKDKAEWKSKLEEYGIYQDEWRHLMEPLNSDEGGMSQFFTRPQFKTADQLIDGLFIPAVETRLGQSSQSADSSLATMLINYVKRYEQQAENIQSKERCLKFLEDIRSLQEDVQRIWTLWDSRNKILGSMFGYFASLEQEVRALDTELGKLDQAIKNTEDALYHMDWEDASEDYYQCESAARQSGEALEQAKQLQEELKAQQEADQKRQKVLTAARDEQRRRELQSKLDGIRKSIADKTSGDDTATQLGASVRAAVSAVLPGQRDACQVLETAAQAARQAFSDAAAVLKTAKDNERRCFAIREREDTAWSMYCGQTDSLINSLQIDAVRNLSGLYMTEELEEACKERQTRLDAVRAELEQIERERKETESALSQIPEERANLRVQSQEAKKATEKIQTEIDGYRAMKESIREICRFHDLDFEARFSGSVREYLIRRRNEQRQEIEAARREEELTGEEFLAAKNGTVHVPRKILDCLDQSGIAYQTCERYFLTQIERENLTAADCVEILKGCPSAAYGILPDDPSLLNEIRVEWLPASIPVFSSEEMEAVLKRKAVRPGNFSRYSVQSFLDRANYMERLRGKIKDVHQRMEQRQESLKETEAQLKRAEDFGRYDADWLARQEERSQKLRGTYEDCQTRLKALDEAKNAKQSRRDKLEKMRKEREREKQNLETWLDRFTDLREGLDLEEAAFQSRSEAVQNHKASEEEVASACRDWEQAKHEADRQATALREEQEKLQKMEAAAREVADCTAQATEAGEWFDLYQQYKTLLANQNADLCRLQAEADDVQKDLTETEADLSSTGVDKREYQGVSYSREEWDSLELRIKGRGGQLEEAQEALFIRNGEAATAKANLENARKTLEQYGGQPLEQTRIGGNRGKRRKEYQDKRAALQKEQEQLSSRVQAYNRQMDSVGDKLEEMRKPESISHLPLEADYKRQWKNLREKFRSQSASLSQGEKTLQDKLRTLSDKFAGSVQGDFLKHAMDLLKNSPQGDVYFTLDGQIDDCIHATDLNISRLETDLEDFQHMKRELIHQCCVQGEQIYHELMDMMKSTRIQLGGTGRRTEMIRFGLPDETNPQRAEEEITAELEEGTKKLLERMGDKSVSETEVRKLAERIVSSGVLLRKYVQREQISLKAYKVDAIEGNGEYRTWEKTLVNSSGAEKFLVYFSIILALMNYARDGASLGDGHSAGVLILDNPFGVITSPHVLDPMFRIARKFRIQLICLSDITKCDITTCFDTVIRAVVRENPLSSVSLLTHEGNERIEHGFYRSVQLSL